MAHLEQQIVDALQALLVPVSGIGSGHVHDGEPRTFEAADLPALVIETGSDAVAIATAMRPRILRHSLDVSVTIFLKQAMPRATLRSIRLDVEKRIAAASPNLGGLTNDLVSTGVGEIETVYETDVTVARVALKFLATYSHLETTPDVAY